MSIILGWEGVFKEGGSIHMGRGSVNMRREGRNGVVTGQWSWGDPFILYIPSDNNLMKNLLILKPSTLSPFNDA